MRIFGRISFLSYSGLPYSSGIYLSFRNITEWQQSVSGPSLYRYRRQRPWLNAG